MDSNVLKKYLSKKIKIDINTSENIDLPVSQWTQYLAWEKFCYQWFGTYHLNNFKKYIVWLAETEWKSKFLSINGKICSNYISKDLDLRSKRHQYICDAREVYFEYYRYMNHKFMVSFMIFDTKERKLKCSNLNLLIEYNGKLYSESIFISKVKNYEEVNYQPDFLDDVCDIQLNYSIKNNTNEIKVSEFVLNKNHLKSYLNRLSSKMNKIKQDILLKKKISLAFTLKVDIIGILQKILNIDNQANIISNNHFHDVIIYH